VRRAQSRDTREDRRDPANFLDKAPGAAFGGEDNAAFTDRNDAAGRALNADGFIRGPVRLADGEVAVNDRLAVVTYDDLMPRVMRRVAGEVARCIRAQTPAPVPPCRQSLADAALAWSGVPGTRFGRVPGEALEACGLSSAEIPNWWRAWRLHVFYARGVQPVDAAHRASGPPRDFAVLVSGAALGSQSHAEADAGDPAQWLEGPHPALARLDAAPACPGETARAPCASGACDRVVLAARDAARNDVVVVSP